MNLKYLTRNDLPEIMALQHVVYNMLEDKEVLQTLNEDEFKEIIDQGFIVGICDQHTLVGIRAMYIPPVDYEEHLADDAELTEKDKVIFSEISFINPSYRGRRLQTKMGEELIGEVKKDGRFDYILTTVMPYNLASLKDKFRLGFKIVKTSYKYNGKKRHILQLNLQSPLAVTGGAKKVHFAKTDWMLKNSEYYIGDSLEDDHIHYYERQNRC
ncbi:N-acetyltransferase [Salinicoccus albus]|uniref:N-acetyltransferase n=1 Tax=Salinicoccus albus TaxID=418756 RepID=UPI00035D053C|nr:N-acetyltransferase [Salinicoccus albus]